jgi:hypothetical protein
MLRYFCFLFCIFLAACNNPNEHINKQLKDRYERKTDLMSLKYINSDFSFIEDLYRLTGRYMSLASVWFLRANPPDQHTKTSWCFIGPA